MIKAIVSIMALEIIIYGMVYFYHPKYTSIPDNIDSNQI